MNGGKTLLVVQNLKKYFYSSQKLFSISKERPVVKAVDDVSFNIYKGETFGIVGESGCGKSTLGRSIIRLIEPTDGKILYRGIDLRSLSKEEMRLMRNELQLIFQDPYASLNPRMTVKELIKAPLDVFSNETEKDKIECVADIMEMVGLDEEYMNKYPHEFSGGQRQRIGIARALILNPKFIICDEPVSALDVSVRAQVLNLMRDMQKEFNLTYMFVSHDLNIVRLLCDRIAVMYLGKIVEIATKDDLYNNAKHPYTQALLSSNIELDTDIERIILEGDVPSSYDPPNGCYFHTRCRYASQICKTTAPEMKELENGSYVACHLYNN